ncbi:nucleotidyltransferase [Empedobacter sp. GD03797]|uniref:nucleotidyltransferase n=1 Tax=Empedobacter sp. GD03797 TaxID=2975382 RepID=UPI002449B832|nr:nucleotidyltransferase [Empedobacter sp. GD03797]MDH1880922.1 nucleotidyltransferase [Empedobacter sp. GD03797]
MRVISDIKLAITKSFIANETFAKIYGLDQSKSFEDQFSKVSFESVLFDIMSIAIYAFEVILDKHYSDVTQKLTEEKAHTARWYRSKALAFQFGFDLVVDSDEFNNTNYTTEQISESKIVKYAAVVEAENDSRLIVKIAGETDGELNRLNEQQVASFKTYMQEIRDAGVKLTVINYEADKLFLDLQINYDPLVLSANGQHLINANYPIVDAIKAYMKELPFNGELVLAHLVDKLQQVEGVLIPTIMSASTSWIDENTNSYGDAIGIAVKAIPVSGYFKVESFDNIRYVV